ncbi:MAG: hypothetical protein JXQ81_12140 [Desulfuromonadales bacterium]|nr:hypothetical protein [Desulfuromonadales bacterium]MBN2793249.1 hypothetical protein [Desulfuromonadales bacterium]
MFLKKMLKEMFTGFGDDQVFVDDLAREEALSFEADQAEKRNVKDQNFRLAINQEKDDPLHHTKQFCSSSFMGEDETGFAITSD